MIKTQLFCSNFLLFVILVLGCNNPALPQSIINTEKLYADDSSTVNFIFEPGLDFQSGNTDVTEVFGTVNFIYRPSKNLIVKVLGGGDVLIEGRREIVNDQFAQGRFVQVIHRQIEVYEFCQWQSSLNLLLNNRQLYGGGARFKFFHQDSNAVFIDYSIGVFQELEKLDPYRVIENGDYVNKLKSNVTRFSTFLVFELDLSPKIGFVNTTYFQPILGRFSDYRLLNEADLGFNVFKWLDFNLNFTYRFDSKAPDILKSEDFFITLGAVIHAKKK